MSPPLTFTSLHPVFAAECSGVDIGGPITPQTAAAIEDAMDRYAVLVFRRSTPLTTEQQLAFTRSLGELEPPYRRIQPAPSHRTSFAVPVFAPRALLRRHEVSARPATHHVDHRRGGDPDVATREGRLGSI